MNEREDYLRTSETDNNPNGSPCIDADMYQHSNSNS